MLRRGQDGEPAIILKLEQVQALIEPFKGNGWQAARDAERRAGVEFYVGVALIRLSARWIQHLVIKVAALCTPQYHKQLIAQRCH